MKIFTRTGAYVRKTRKARSLAWSESPVPGYMKSWACEMLEILRVEVAVRRELSQTSPAIWVGNHASYLDIPLLMSIAPVVFIAKKQIGSWPVFGPAAQSIGTIFVDRDSKGSRGTIPDAIAPRLRIGQSVTIFPSGTTTIHEEKPWRWGAFRIAKEIGVPIQPFRIRYSPARRAAFLLEDSLVPHLWKLIDEGGLHASIDFHDPVEVHQEEKVCDDLYRWCREGIALCGK